MEVLAECSFLMKKERDHEVERATLVGLENAKKLLHSLSRPSLQSSHHHHHHQQTLDREGSEAAEVAISKFQKVVSLLSRTGHARFRRGPSQGAPSFSALSNVFIDNNTHCGQEDLKRKREPYPGATPVLSDLLHHSAQQHQQYQQQQQLQQVDLKALLSIRSHTMLPYLVGCLSVCCRFWSLQVSCFKLSGWHDQADLWICLTRACWYSESQFLETYQIQRWCHVCSFFGLLPHKVIRIVCIARESSRLPSIIGYWWLSHCG